MTTRRGALAAALVLALAAGLLTGCGAEAAEARRPLLLISIDGFRWDYLDTAEAPHLRQLADGGLRAERLLPVYPTKTFPNHYTAVTGLYPSRHGIVANVMNDPELGLFTLRNRDAVEDGRWWQGEPIWVTAEKQGVKAATCFWPGSEAEIAGFRPSHWRRYDAEFGNRDRVKLVFEWLDLPQPQRPDFLTLYFNDVDSAAHAYGPDAPETRAAIAAVDAEIGVLVAGLRERGLLDAMHILVIADHGMAATPSEQTVYLADYLELSDIEVTGGTPALLLRPPPERVDAVASVLADAHPHLRVLRTEDTPAAWHFRDHPRIPPLIAMVDEGWNLRPVRGGTLPGGMHGYPPELESMHAVFIGHGPGLVKGRTGPVRMIDLYELMCRLLDLDPAPNDGDPSRVEPLLDPR
ncbi:MAG: ectonucleotide pyrophosphatase/phosphodiesterase [Thermoanaerobaculia bacterium]|nr:ectonucleotide pyrophosphatase/phosphodiesterase [Thermoanaerobaculia bacterium]